MTAMKLTHRDIKTITVNMFHTFEKVEKKHEHDMERNGRCKNESVDLKHILPEMKI